MVRIAPGMRQKLYLILVFISLVLFFYSSWQVRPVVVEPADSIGLVSHLTPVYWIGLALTVAVSISAFLDHELKRDAVFIFILLVLGLFLIGLPVFVYENATEPEAYYPFGEVRNLLATNHLDISETPSLSTYHVWPTMHLFSASILTVTGLDLPEFGQGFIRYVPVFFMLLIVLITYSIGKQYKLTPNRCFALSFLSLASWLFIYEYTPRALGMVLFLLLFMLLMSGSRSLATIVMAVLTYGVLVMTHGLSALVVIPALVIFTLYMRESRLVVLVFLFIVIFCAWYVFLIPSAVEIGLNTLLQPMRDIFHYAETETYFLPSSAARAVSRYTQLGFVALYALLMLGSVLWLLMRRKTFEYHKQVIALLCWSIPIGLLILGGYEQVMIRGYVFLIVPAVCIAVLALVQWRWVIVSAMIICVALNLPANYAGQVSGEQILTTEVRGARFFALEVQPPDTYYYGYSLTMILYNNPALISIPVRTLTGATPGEINFSEMDELHYILMSKQGTDFKLFAWGEDPTAGWPQSDIGRESSLIYDNGQFQIYVNNAVQ
ncbi:MAG TPA: hypothetical protein G4O18_02675 [Dehalococcoidia bacterium]|nr:hypothetical protein [Dehalococcoidia bacterium]